MNLGPQMADISVNNLVANESVDKHTHNRTQHFMIFKGKSPYSPVLKINPNSVIYAANISHLRT